MLDKNPKHKEEMREKRRKAAESIFLITAILMFATGIYYSLQAGVVWRYSSINIQAFIIGFAGLIAYLFVRQKQLLIGVFLVLAVSTSSVFITILNYSGLNLLLAIVILLIYLFIGGLTLSRKIAERVIIFSVFLSIGIVFVGFLDPVERAKHPFTFGPYFFIALLVIVYAFSLRRQYYKYTLRTKLVLSFSFVSAIGLGLAFTVANYNIKTVLSENGRQRLLAEAESSSDKIDSYLAYNRDTVASTASYLDLRSYFELGDERSGSPEEFKVQTLLNSLSNRRPEILSFGVLDLHGNVLLDSYVENIGNSEAQYRYFRQAVIIKNTYISPVLYLDGDETGAFFISVPIYSDTGKKVGVLRAKYRASILQDFVSQEADRHDELFGSGAYYVLLDDKNIVLAHKTHPELIGRTPATPSEDEFLAWQAAYRLPPTSNLETIGFDFTALDSALKNAPDTKIFEDLHETQDTVLIGASVALENTNWRIVALQPESEFSRTVHQQARTFFALALGAVLFAITAGSWLSSLLISPILRLQNVARRFADGDLDAQAFIETEDEVGELAKTFNELANRLKETVFSLEDRVQDRTNDLELRSRYLEGAAEIGQLATNFTDADELADTVVELIRERFDLYYVGLFLADESQEWAVLRSGTGVAGEIMLANAHKLKIGEGMIGWTIKYGEARIALDVGDDAVRFDNPVLPETRSEGALPLRSRGRTLGAISVQSKEPKAFSMEILTTLATMADQIAVAFDNAELLRKAEAALEAERRAYGELSLLSWHDIKRRNQLSAFRVGSNGLVRRVAETEVHARQQVEGQDPSLQEDDHTLILPIRSRGHIIGGIRIEKHENARPWSKNQLELIKVISGQLSVALESARLFEEAQVRAQREAIISDISAKVGSSMRMDTILKTTVEELGKALDGADISFEIKDAKKG